MRTIRASEIGTFLFCRRSWWFQRQGVESQNQAELSGGSQYHRRHGRQEIQSVLLRLAGWLLLFIAILLLVVALMLQWLG
jgi:hypothetical protein